MAVLAFVAVRAYGWWTTPGSDGGPRFGMLEMRLERWGAASGEGTVTRRLPMTFKRLTQGEYGERWPLTVDTAWVGCARDLPIFTVLLVVDGTAWALNGTTKGWAKGGRYRLTIDGQPKVVQVSDEPEWWALDGKTVIFGMVAPRKSISPLFDVVREMGCLDLPAKAGS